MISSGRARWAPAAAEEPERALTRHLEVASDQLRATGRGKLGGALATLANATGTG